MKRGKKFVSLLLALTMVFAMAMTVHAEGETETGSITINDSTNVSVAGKTFHAYKILDVVSYTAGTNGKAGTVVYTVPAELKEFYKTRYALKGTEGDFDYQVVQKIQAEQDLFAFAAAALTAAKNAGITSVSATAAEGAHSVTIDKLPLGYYVVEDAGTEKPISALILDTTNPNVTLNIKADKPSVDKKIDGETDTDDATKGDVKYNNAAIGDKIPYKVTSKVPDMTGYTKYYFVVNDTLSAGLTFNNDVAITVGSKTLVQDTDYTVTATKNADETTSVEIVFKNFVQYQELKESENVLAKVGSDILITYSATLNENAVIGTAGNPNEVILTYSNNPNVKDAGTQGNPDKPTPDSPTGKTPEEVTRTYVTGLEIIKVDGEGNRLTGAEFKLEGTKLNTVLVRKDDYKEDENGKYWKLKDGSYTTTAPVTATDETDTTKYYESTTTKYSKTIETTKIVKAENVTYTATVGEDGVLRFDGLSAGTYTITEIKAPNGYNLLKDPIVVTITFAAPTEEGVTDCTWTYTGTDLVNGERTSHITVTNQAGAELPSTGGAGTTIFYVLGGILVLAAAVLLVVRRRMSVEK